MIIFFIVKRNILLSSITLLYGLVVTMVMILYQVICRHNTILYGRSSAMKFPNSQWPTTVNKGKGNYNTSQPKNFPPRRLDPVTMPTNTSLLISDNSFHRNSDESPVNLEVEDTSSNGLSAIVTKRPVLKHNQLTRRPLYTYTPAGAGSVSVNGTGIKASQPYPPPTQY